MKSSCVILLATLLNVIRAYAADPTHGQINDPDGYTNVRSGPSTNQDIVATVRENEFFQILEYGNSWSMIKTPAGRTGYMHTSRISPLAESVGGPNSAPQTISAPESDDNDYQPPNYSEEDRAKILGEPTRSINIGEPDHSDETMAKLRPLLPQADAAYDRGDYPEAFSIYLKMWDECHIPLIRFSVISSAFRCVDRDKVEKGDLLSDKIYDILSKCPAPLFNEDQSQEAFALEHAQYAMMQYALGNRSNLLRDFGSAEIYIARAEAFFESAKVLGPNVESISVIPGTQWVSQARSVIRSNRGVDRYYQTLGAIKTIFNGGRGRPDGLIRCPHCSKGDVYFDRKNALGHWVTGSKPCVHCHGTGWVEAHRP